jgi:hypothetical protein
MISSNSDTNWITIVMLILFGMLVLAHYLYENRFLKLLRLFNSKQYIFDYVKKVSTIFHPFNILLLAFNILSFSLLILKFVLYLDPYLVTQQYLIFIKINFAIMAFYSVRYSFGKLISILLSVENLQEKLTFLKTSYLIKVSILIFPSLIILYFFRYWNDILLLSILIMTLIYLLYKYLQILVQNQKIIFRNLYYFILYLCALEIIPFLFIYKILIDKA